MGWCCLCDKTKPDSHFHLLARPNKSGRKIQAACIQCEDQSELFFLPTNRKIDKFFYLNQYKLGRYIETRVRRYNKLFAAQGGRCAICKAWPVSRPLNVDHNHKTGKVRGLLCTRCNVRLGKWRDNPPDNQPQFIKYLCKNP